MKKTIITLVTVLMVAIGATAQDPLHSGWLSDVEYGARVGYSIGGSAPLGMPATIRKLNKFPLTPNISFGVNAHKPLGGNWGFMAGLKFENKGMSTDCTVKNYHMEIVRGGERLSGVFTGKVVTKTTQWMFTLPLQATFKVGNVLLKAGPYVSYLTYREFSGYAYNGYLRVGNPTGEKVNLGEEEGQRGDYDFSEDMRKLQTGLDIGADWHFSKRFGAYADLSWGISSVHKSGFKTIEQTLYPIYGTIGLTYTFK